MNALNRVAGFSAALILAGMAFPVSASSVYGYTHGATVFKTLEEAEASMRADPHPSAPAMELAFTMPGDILSAGSQPKLDYRPFGAIGNQAPVLRPPGEITSSRYRLFTAGWPPVTRSPACSAQWSTCSSGDCLSISALADVAACEFDQTWLLPANASRPAFCWTRQAPPGTTASFGGPTVTGVGQQSGTFVYAPPSSTSSSWGATVRIQAFACVGQLGPEAEAPKAATSTEFVWNTRGEQTLQCPSGTRVQAGASTAGNGCGAELIKELIEPPKFTQTPSQCGLDGLGAGEGNPCFPGSGGKQVTEPGFNYGEIKLDLHYDSLRQTRRFAYIDRNWSHTFAKRVLTEWSMPDHLQGAESNPIANVSIAYLQDDRGQLEQFVRRAGEVGVFRSSEGVGKVLTYVAAQGAAPPFWQLELTNGVAETYDRAGRLVQIISPDPTKSLVLTYLGGVIPLSATTSTTTIHQAEEFWRINQIRDGRGRYVTFEYSGVPSFWLTAVKADDGTTSLLSLGYDTAHRLVSLGYAGGASRTLVYNEPANIFVGGPTPSGIVGYWLTGIRDEDNRRYATYQYDDWGRAKSSWHGTDHGRVSIDYVDDMTTRVTYPLGAQKTIRYAVGQPYRHKDQEQHANGTVRFGYTGTRQTEITDRNGSITRVQYDTAGENIVKRTEALGTPEQRRIETDWDPATGRLAERRVYADPTNTGTGTLEGRTTYAYDSAARMTSKVESDPNTLETRTWTYAYCSAADVTSYALTGCAIAGQLRTVNGPRVDVIDTTTYKYRQNSDSSCVTGGACTFRQGDLWTVRNAIGHVTEYASYDKAGRPLRIKDANGVLVDHVYHARGWIAKRIVRANADGSPSAQDAATQYDYDLSGNLIKTTHPDGSFLSLTYDSAHRVTDVADNLGNTIHYKLDSAGNRTVERKSDVNGVLRQRLARAYDTFGRLDVERDALGATGSPLPGTDTDDNSKGRLISDYAYDANGNRIERVDGLGRDTDHEFDPLDRLKRTLDALRPQCPQGDTYCGKTSYAYDARDNLRQVTDAKGLATLYVYDGLSNLDTLTSPDTGTTVYTQDAAGNRLTQRDGRGITTTYSYDALNRLAGITYPSAALNTTFFYDVVPADCSTSEQFGKGRLGRMVDSSGETRYCHDRRGNVVRRVQTIPNGSLETRWEYDLSDRVSSITYPSGPIVNYVRDLAGRVTGVTYKATPGSTPQSIVSSATYLPFGPLATITYGNGRTLTKAYDRNYAIDAIGTTPSNGLTVDYKVDVVGNITQIDEGSPAPVVRAFEYDGLDRLRFARDQGSAVIEGYSYDAVGNRLSKQVAAQAPFSLTYYPGSHRLSTVGGVSRVYDGAGNTTGIGARMLGFDQQNRLVAISDPAQGSLGAYTYNGRGERVAKFSQSVLASPQTSTIYYVFGMDGMTLAEALLPPPEPCVCPPGVVCTDAVCDEEQRGGAVVAGYEEDILGLQWRDYVYLEGVPIAVLDAGGLTYLETDHLGSPRAAISPTTNVPVWRWSFTASAFGENLPNEQPGGSAPFKLNLRFPGQYYDTESGMHYNYFRDYEPGTGRYVESDPIGLAGDVSTYGYVGGSPMNHRDIWGLARCRYSVSEHTLSCASNTTFDPTFVGPPDLRKLGPDDTFSGVGECRNNPSQDCADSSLVGPIPPGSYNMNLDSRQCCANHWRLEPDPPVRWWEYYSGMRRNGFKLHPGTRSLGCITVLPTSISGYEWVHGLLLQEQGTNSLTVEP